MAFDMEILSLDPHFPLVRRVIAPTRRTPLGGGAMQVRRQWPTPAYEFVLSEKQADPAKLRELWGFFAFFQGDQPFWIYQANNPLFDVPSSDPIMFARGDGTQKQFFLPNRNIAVGTFQAWHSTTRRGGSILASP